MNYDLIKDVVDLVKNFEAQNVEGTKYAKDVNGFQSWVADSFDKEVVEEEPDWEGKEAGRSSESVISTLLVHMNRYARSYSKAAIFDSEFSTQEDFIFLITLKTFGSMSKMDLVKKNIQEKPVGMQIINRLIKQEWVDQTDSEVDKRSKLVHINEKGLEALGNQMEKIRDASKIVVGNLRYNEQMQLIRLLNKLNDFHHPIYLKNLSPDELLEEASESINN